MQQFDSFEFWISLRIHFLSFFALYYYTSQHVILFYFIGVGVGLLKFVGVGVNFMRYQLRRPEACSIRIVPP